MTRIRSATAGTILLALAGAVPAAAQVPEQTLGSISTPDTVETRLGTLRFDDGAPSPETLQAVYDNLDFTHAFETFVNTLQGVSIRPSATAFAASA
jgi:hypothetical protein